MQSVMFSSARNLTERQTDRRTDRHRQTAMKTNRHAYGDISSLITVPPWDKKHINLQLRVTV